MKPRAPVRKQNRARLKKRRAECFGPKADWLRGFACAVLSSPTQTAHSFGNSIPAHTKSRGAGGKSKHLIPLCQRHHDEQHQSGVKTFATKYGLDLETLAAKYEAYWHQRPQGEA